MSLDDVRTELVRSRGFIRGAETQLTKALDALDAHMAEEPAPDPTPDPPPPDPDPQPSGDVLFTSTFEGSDITDNGKWVETIGFNDPSVAQVFDTSLDPDVPGGRGLRIIGPEGDDFWLNFVPSNPPPVPAVGESITWRWYWKWVRGDGDDQYHPVAFGGDTVSPPPVGAVISYMRQGDGILPWVQLPTGEDFQPGYEPNGRMKPGEWYRQEFTWTRVDVQVWRIGYRIYDLAGSLVYDDGDLMDNYGGGTRSLGASDSRQGSPDFATLWTGFGNGVNESANPHEQDRWAAIVAIAGDVQDVPYPVVGES